VQLAPVAAALAAALCLGFGFVLQQRVAATVPQSDVLTLRLLRDLVVQPAWLAGIASMVVGQLLGALALRMADISLVEPLLTVNILFALGISARLAGRHLRLRDWVGVAMLTGGITVFLLAAHPAAAGEAAQMGLTQWVTLAATGAVAAAAVVVARSRSGAGRAALLAAAAGILFGLQDGLTRQVTLLLGSGVPALVARWEPWVLLLIAVTGLVLAESAFASAPLQTSLPPLTIAEPLAGIGVGIGYFGEQLRTAPDALMLESAGLLAMVFGCLVLTSSPLLASIAHTHGLRRR
jgi:drug/metabolite transporter (DMT)-like permease